MVFSEDLRAGYGKFNFNVAWFYQYLSDRGQELVHKIHSPKGYEYSDDEISNHSSILERNLESAVNAWISYSVFGNESKRLINNKEIDLSGYEDVWDVMNDTMLDFIARYDDFELKDVE